MRGELKAQRPESTRDRIATAARQLFAEHGYRGTSIVAIEEAAGLKPGTGALYTHYKSKLDVLADVLERVEASTREGYAYLDLLPLGDLRAELTLLGRAQFAYLDMTRDYRRIMLKEHDRFPELFLGARRIQEDGYSWFAEWLADRAQENGNDRDVFDSSAVATVALTAVTAFWDSTSLYKRVSHQVSRERFLSAWVDLLYHELRRSAAEASTEADGRIHSSSSSERPA